MLKTRLMAPPMLDRFPHALMKPNTGCAYAHTGLLVAPDWLLGALFGIGGFLGMYCGARLQKYFPARFIKLILVLAILFLGVTTSWPRLPSSDSMIIFYDGFHSFTSPPEKEVDSEIPFQ
jgi:hypothetical protein